MDGKQRLTNVLSYIRGEYELTDKVADVVIDEEVYQIAGKYFCDLDEPVKYEILRYHFDIIAFEDCTTTEVEEIFYRLNNSKPLTSAQTAKAVAGTEFAIFINKLLKEKFFKEKMIMRVTMYDARVTEDFRTELVKESAVNYECDRDTANSPGVIAKMMRDVFELDLLAEEHLYMIALNAKSRIIGVFLIAKGSVNASQVGSREIFMRALMVGATNIIICHNHPSSMPSPSRQDDDATRMVTCAGEIIGVKLIDHIIVCRDSYYSYHESLKM